MYNRTKYYDTDEAIRHHALSQMAASFPTDWKDAMTAARKRIADDTRTFDQRRADIEAVDTAVAQALGVAANDLTDAYYYL